MCGGKLFLKKDAVPHIFECQNRMMPLKPRSVVMKRKRREILESIEKTQGVDTSNVEPQIKEEREEHDDDLETDIPSFRINIEMEHEDEIKEEITIEENSFQCRICLSVGRRMSPLEEYEEIYKKLLFDKYQDQNDLSLSTLTTVVFSDSNPEIIYLIEADKQTDQLNSETDTDDNPEDNELLIERKTVKREPKLKMIEDVETFRRVDFDLNGLKEVPDERRNEESHKQSRFNCSTCILSFDDENKLSEHNRECHDEAKKEKKKVSKAKTKLQEYEGKIRIVMLTMEEMLEERRAEALKKNYLQLPYKCEYCITGFDHELTLKSHMKARHDKKSNGIECKICNSIIGTKTSFNEHHKRHFRRYECIECGRRNNYVRDIRNHYNEKHGGIKTVFTCELCDYSTE
ncbi:unnamed protein product [Euphydryas editha]|uniref:C2H2-type domain-containing protein n=1 Tax=Euphydryas editha TaxID=104508 RepID=A0AAU9T9L2_EUPED|nr:unnamed protein product [Euphydryas editha]